MLIKNSLKSSFQDKKLAGVKLSEASRLGNVLTIRGKTIEKIRICKPVVIFFSKLTFSTFRQIYHICRYSNRQQIVYLSLVCDCGQEVMVTIYIKYNAIHTIGLLANTDSLNGGFYQQQVRKDDLCPSQYLTQTNRDICLDVNPDNLFAVMKTNLISFTRNCSTYI